MGLTPCRRTRLLWLHLLISATVALSSVCVGTAASAVEPVLPPLPAPTPIDPAALTPAQAVAQARQTGRSVDAAGVTNVTDTMAAHPNGTLTLTRHAVPVRKKTGAVWTNLDATLRTNTDGTVSPAVSSSELTFSGGGAGPLVTMRHSGKSLALSMPFAAPIPVLSGPLATYHNVFPGIDLLLTATAAGGFTQVFVVHDAAAATNPALRSLTFSTSGSGVAVSADAVGNLKATDASGRTLFAAPAPIMWDSVEPPAGHAAVDGRSPSTADGPPPGATIKPVTVAVNERAITLTPDVTLLSGPGTRFPVYIDPSWTPQLPTVSGNRSGYASVAKAFPTSKYWYNTADANKDNLQLGWNNSPWHARTMINFDLDLNALAGSTIIAATIKSRSVYSGSCTATKTRVFAPSTTLTESNAYWNFWYNANLEAEIGSLVFRGGYSASCPAEDVTFDVKAGVEKARSANPPRSLQTFVFTGDVNETSDTGSYKELSLASIAMQITYNHVPDKPANLSTSPQTICAGNPVTTVGDAKVTLHAPVHDRNGSTLGVRYEVYKGVAGSGGTMFKSTDPNTFTETSSNTAHLDVTQTELRNQANGAVTEFTWRVQVFDGYATSAWSDLCRFKFDPTRPGQPTVTVPTGDKYIGSALLVTVSPPPTGTVPARYLYQLNTEAPVHVDAVNGSATFSITPTRRTNTLSVTGISPGGNAGIDSAYTPVVTRSTAKIPVAGDITGDDIADLTTSGGTGLPAGIWTAAGKHDGQLAAVPTNIGIFGNGRDADPSPADFNGAKVVTGQFFNGDVQDVFAYYPPGSGTGVEGTAVVIAGTGDGSRLLPQLDGNQVDVSGNVLLDLDENGQTVPGSWPVQLANAGRNTYVSIPALAPDGTDDLIGISGTTATGYHLTYYWCPSEGNIQSVDSLPQATPAGDSDWNQWKIATVQVPSTGKTNMFLWRPSDNSLHLWKDISFIVDTNSGEKTFAYTGYNLSSSGFNPGSGATLHAADVDGDGDADLWTVQSGQVKTHRVTNLSGGSGTIATAAGTQPLNTTTHSWSLTDMPEGAAGTQIGTTADTTSGTALPMTGGPGALWKIGDAFSPSAQLDGIAGTLTAGNPVNTNADFTMSVWVKPAAASGTVLSINGTHTAAMRLYAEASDKSWRLALSRTDATSPTWDTASTLANSVQLGVWTHLAATYNKTTGIVRLYLNGAQSGAATHITGWNPTAAGAFKAGAHRTSSTTHGSYFAGKLSDIKAWAGAVVPPGPSAAEGSYLQKITPKRFLDTRDGIGAPTGPIAAQGTIRLKIGGAHGIPTTGVKAVAVNFATITPGSIGYLTAWADLTVRPNVSTFNFNAGQVNSGYAIVPVGTNGYISIYLNAGSPVHLIADVTGYFTTNATATSSYTPVTPFRFGNTQTGAGGHSGQIPAGTTRTYQIGGTGGIPTGVTAVAVNIAALNSTITGYLNTWEQGQTQPISSGLQFVAGTTTSQMTIIPVNATNGQFHLYSSQSTDLLIDVMGYFTTGTTGQKYYPLTATRIIDTRTGSQVQGGTTINVSGGPHAVGTNTTLVVGCIIIQPTGHGYAAVYPSHLNPRPGVSTLNYTPGQIVSNTALANTGPNAAAGFYTLATTHLVADLTGYFSTND